MPWIESHQSLKDHPKLIALCEQMEWDIDTATGKLHRFWWWCLDYAIDGDLRKFNDAQLAHGMGVSIPHAKKLTAAMVESRWIDRTPYFRVHDWWDYVGKFLIIKWKNYPDKWKAVQTAYAKGVVTTPLTTAPSPSTYLPTDQPNSLSSARESEDPNLWPFKPAVMPPVDPVWNQRWQALHGWYEQQMGATIRLDMNLERLWFEWFKCDYQEDQFKRVFKYLRDQIKQRKRNDGALKLSNMLQPDRFSEDLGLATMDKRPLVEKKAQVLKLPDKPLSAEAIAKGKEEIAKMRQALKP